MTQSIVDMPVDGELHAVVTRANGEVVDLGIISATYRKRWRRWWWEQVRRPLANRRIRRFNERNERIRAEQGG